MLPRWIKKVNLARRMNLLGEPNVHNRVRRGFFFYIKFKLSVTFLYPFPEPFEQVDIPVWMEVEEAPPDGSAGYLGNALYQVIRGCAWRKMQRKSHQTWIQNPSFHLIKNSFWLSARQYLRFLKWMHLQIED